MKIGIILLSIFAAGSVWWWNVHRLGPMHGVTFSLKFKNFFKSLIAGVIVYFSLMTITLLYLMFTTP